MMKWLLAACLALAPVAARAAEPCIPANAPPGSTGCKPTASSAAGTDYLDLYQPSLAPNSSHKITIDNLFNGHGGGGNFSSPPPVGDVTPNTGAFSTLIATTLTGTFAGNPIFSGIPNFTGAANFAGNPTFTGQPTMRHLQFNFNLAPGVPSVANTQLLGTAGIGGPTSAIWGPLWFGYSDSVDATAAEVYIFRLVDTLNTGWRGGRQVMHLELNALNPVGAPHLFNGGELNVLSTITRLAVNVGGTALTAGSSQGQVFGGSMNAVVSGTATNTGFLASLNPQVLVTAGASVVHKYGYLQGMGVADAVQGSLTDAAFGVASDDAALTDWRTVYSVGGVTSRNPFAADTTLFQAFRRQVPSLETEITATSGRDISAMSFSAYIDRAQNYGVDGTGRVFAAGLTTTGALQARTAGVASLALSAFGGLTGGSYADFPTLVIQAPPSGGVQATAHVATVALTRVLLTDPGSGCTAGDVLTMTVVTGTPGTIIVDTVNGSGAVLTFHVGAAGSMSAWNGSAVTTGGTCSARPSFTAFVSILTTAIDAAGSGYGEKPPPRVFGVSGVTTGELVPAVLTATMSVTNAVLSLNAAGGGLSMNGVAAVSCASGAVTAATMVVTNGVVSHC